MIVYANNASNMAPHDAIKNSNFPEWEDEAVEGYWMMGSPYPVTLLMAAYLVFVTYLGPRVMAERKPLDLKYTMMAYNIVQVLYNIWFLCLFFGESKMLGYLLQEACRPTYPPHNRALRLFAFKVTWVWLMSKVADLVDTVFFVLRKKQNQITFLHLYHHTHMVASVWLYLKYVRGEQGIMIGLVNSVVHVIMYSYYFLSALGPGVQRYLWWKRYITWIQLFQFFVLLMFFMTLLVRCATPPLQTAYNAYAALQGVIFTALFLNFYFNSYSKPHRKNSKMHKNVENCNNKQNN